jgi:hypothetical protein
MPAQKPTKAQQPTSGGEHTPLAGLDPAIAAQLLGRPEHKQRADPARVHEGRPVEVTALAQSRLM